MAALRVISSLWMLVGLAVVAWSIYGEVSMQSEFGFMAGSFAAAVIAAMFGLLAIAGGVLTLKERRAGASLLGTVCILAALYAVVFFMFGREDRGYFYALGVGGLLFLAAASLLLLVLRASRAA